MALCKSTIICENPQIFAVEVHKYFCFLRHSLRPTPDVYNNVLPLDLPTVYCPGLHRRGFKEASHFYAFDTFFIFMFFIFTFLKKHLEIFYVFDTFFIFTFSTIHTRHPYSVMKGRISVIYIFFVGHHINCRPQI